MDSEISAKVFQNPLILEKILTSVLNRNNTIPNQSLRLVSKSFDRGYLSFSRKKNREIRIEAKKSVEASVFVNYEEVEIMKLASYFKFLKSVVKLNVRSLKVCLASPLAQFNPALWKLVHDTIVKGLIRNNYSSIEKLVGLTDLCDGCSDCVKVGTAHREYGPIYPLFFENCKAFKHFDNLIVSDPQLSFIANDSKSFGQLKNRLPWISCRNLTIDVSETRGNLIENNFVLTPMPRELVEIMIEKWKVKSVRINSHFVIKDNLSHMDNNREFITPFRLTNPIKRTEKSKINFKLEHVELNLTESSQCTIGITTGPENHNIYLNVIGNIRRMFPTDHIKITGVFVPSSTFPQLYSVLDCLLNTMYYEKQSNLRVDVELFTQMNESHFVHFPKLFVSNRIDQDGEVHICSVEDSSIYRVSQHFDRNRPVNYSGKRVTYKRKNSNCVINFDVFACFCNLP